jgi:hypothetical protein
MTMYEDDSELGVELENTKNKLLAFSLPFKKMVAKAQGRDEAEVDGQAAGSATGSILNEDLVGISENLFKDALVEDDELGGTAKTFDQNIASLENENENK